MDIKMAIFQEQTIADMDQSVNEWLESEEPYKILNMTQSESATSNYRLTITILYIQK
jgi:hypothetical protein